VIRSVFLSTVVNVSWSTVPNDWLSGEPGGGPTGV